MAGKRKGKGKGKKEAEEVNKYEKEFDWTNADYVVDKEVKITEAFQKLLNQFKRPLSSDDRLDFWEN